MILPLLVLILIAGALLAWISGRFGNAWPRWIALAALAIDLVLALSMTGGLARPGFGVPGALESLPAAALGGEELGAPGAQTPDAGIAAPWIREYLLPWFPSLGVRIHLAVDGLSLILLLLTCVLGLLSVACSWREVTVRVGFFHANLLLVLAGVVGVFVSLDLFLFYFFWELMLVPLYFLIGIWGHEKRIYAAVKFFLFTQASGLLMLLGILGLVFTGYRETGVFTFDSTALVGLPIPYSRAIWLMLGFVAAFFVKIPAVPVHTWLPDAHTEAPTAGSVILAGLLLKTGAYGIFRFAVPLFPEASRAFAPVAMWLGAAGVVYGAVLAFAQTDFKRLVAYTSVSHMGFVIIGIYAGTALAQQGAVLEMVTHGLSTGGLFILAGILQERLHTRDLGRMGGLWSAAPRMGGVALILAMASLGLPGLGNFLAEFLILAGAFPVNPAVAVVGAIGLIYAMAYALRFMQRIFYGPKEPDARPRDLSLREGVTFAILVAGLLWLGLYPQPLLDAAAPALAFLREATAVTIGALPGR